MSEQEFEKIWMAFRITPDESKVAFRKIMQDVRNQALEEAAKIADGYIGCSHIADKILDLKRS